MPTSDQPARVHSLLKLVSAALHRRPIRWGLGSISLAYHLLLVVLLITEQLRWLRPVWSPSVTHALFLTFLADSALCMTLFGVASVGSAILLYRRRATDTWADGITLVQRGFVLPLTYLLSILWSWS